MQISIKRRNNSITHKRRIQRKIRRYPSLVHFPLVLQFSLRPPFRSASSVVVTHTQLSLLHLFFKKHQPCPASSACLPIGPHHLHLVCSVFFSFSLSSGAGLPCMHLQAGGLLCGCVSKNIIRTPNWTLSISLPCPLSCSSNNIAIVIISLTSCIFTDLGTYLQSVRNSAL